MNTCKLIFRNVCKNIRDYLIYFLTLTLSVSLFYAFNSISDQPAFSNMGMTGTLLYRQLGIMLSTLSTMIAVVLAFLILYANQFLLKRRKKELGVYMMLGMKKRAYFPVVCRRNALCRHHCAGHRIAFGLFLFARVFFDCIAAFCNQS